MQITRGGIALSTLAFIAYILRNNPRKYGFDVVSDGYFKVSAVANFIRLSEDMNFSDSDLVALIKADTKHMFGLNSDYTLLRLRG